MREFLTYLMFGSCVAFCAGFLISGNYTPAGAFAVAAATFWGHYELS